MQKAVVSVGGGRGKERRGTGVGCWGDGANGGADGRGGVPGAVSTDIWTGLLGGEPLDKACSISCTCALMATFSCCRAVYASVKDFMCASVSTFEHCIHKSSPVLDATNVYTDRLQ